MADLSKMKRRLAAPPTPDDVRENLRAPEIAPAPAPAVPSSRRPATVEDGRSARKTGRTIQFATRVTEGFDERFRATAKRDGLLLSQLLERALDAYEGR